MANEKRKRSANWMASEKSLLVDLVTEHFNVMENKRTDGVSMKQKLGEWVTISNKYNSQTMLSHRTSDNLKAQWESLKKSAKKEASFRRMHLIQTGGGPPRSVIEDPLQQKILCLITPSAVGLHNPFDSDNITFPVTDTVPGPEVQNEYSSDSAVPTVVVDSLLNENNVPVMLVQGSSYVQAQIKSNNNDTKEATNTDYTVNENNIPVVLVPTPANKSPHPQAQMTSNNNDTKEATNTDYIVGHDPYEHLHGSSRVEGVQFRGVRLMENSLRSLSYLQKN
ncbi:unnamed protein product [Euphydryas editha]|uniref:Regulatory protein zeste n=1 Tax=Euphydryas editha TaxID=104508 RepID=A0AAU9TLP7_EUPED|nr:unnamed protein product [Euphydryas editha]